MKYSLLITLSLVALCAAQSFAMKFSAYNGDVEFDHRLHRLLYECTACHEGPEKNFELDHDSGHKLCIGCHRKESKGPARHCSDCHKTS